MGATVFGVGQKGGGASRTFGWRQPSYRGQPAQTRATPSAVRTSLFIYVPRVEYASSDNCKSRIADFRAVRRRQ